MSACPICDELTVNRDMLALGCGHVLCRPCLDKMRSTGSILYCPFCKQRIYDSEVRKLYLYSLDKNELSDEDVSVLGAKTAQSRLEFQQKYIKRLEISEIQMKSKLEELETLVRTLQEKQKHFESEKSMLLSRLQTTKNQARSASMDTQMLKKQVEEVEDYEAARQWMEKNSKSVADLISSSSEGDRRCSRRLAVVLLTVRENYQKVTTEMESTRLTNRKLEEKNSAQQDVIKQLREECSSLKKTVDELVNRASSSYTPKTSVKRNASAKGSVRVGTSFINTLDLPSEKDLSKRNNTT